MSWYRWRGEDLELVLRVQPRASRDELVEDLGDCYRVRIKAPPLEGQANQALCKLIARAFGVPPSRVELIAGGQARLKRLRVRAPRRFPLPIERP